MMRFLRPSRPSEHRTIAGKIGWYTGKAIVWFVAGSVGLTILFKFVPVPVTLTMILDPNGFDKSWTPLSRIDRNIIEAAFEDQQFVLRAGGLHFFVEQFRL